MILSTVIKTLLGVIGIFLISYLLGCIAVPATSLIYGLLTGRLEEAIGYSLASLLAGISALGMIFYLVPGFVSALFSVIVAFISPNNLLCAILGGASAPFTFYFWSSVYEGRLDALQFLIIPICIAGYFSFSAASVFYRFILSHVSASAGQGAAANP